MLQIKDQFQRLSGHLKDSLKGSFKSARKTWLNPAALLHGLRWLEVGPGHARLLVYPNWLGFQTSRFTGALTLACELAVSEALAESDRLVGIEALFVGVESEFFKSERAACEVRFKVDADELERLRILVLEKKTYRHEFVVSLWSLSGQQVGTQRLIVELQLRPYLSA